MQLARTKFSSLLVVCLVPVTVACVSNGGRKPDRGDPAAAASNPPAEFSGAFSGAELRLRKSGLLDGETVWALSQCDCLPGLFKPSLEANTLAQGVLPQILIPAVREEIKGNKALQALQKIPLGGLLADFFASDEKLAAKVREGLDKKIDRAPGGSTLGTRIKFRFDGFSADSDNQDPAGDSFSVLAQIPRWMSVFSADGVWSDGTRIDGIDHGLQLLELLRTLAEWTYLIGLDVNSDGGFYGGLTLRPDGNGTKVNGPVDPRKESGVPWFVSGTYTLKYDEANARELATSVREIWTHNDAPVKLDEQARLWHTAARAFSRLRPDNRKAVAPLFGSGDDAVLPLETHSLPLAFLSGVKALLPEAFINRDARLIRDTASFDGSDEEPAGLLATARLIRALTAWSVGLKSAGDAGLDRATLAKVSAVPDDIKPAVQLAVQTILEKHVVPATDHGGRYGLALTDAGSTIDLAAASEVLLALVEVESELLASEFLRERILRMFDWYAGDLLQQPAEISERELIWVRTAAAAAGRYAAERTGSWAADVVQFADSLLQKEVP